MNRSVRLATAADLDDVLALIHGAASWLHSRGIDQWPHESPTLSAKAIGGHIAAGHTWIAHEDGKPVATIAAHGSDASRRSTSRREARASAVRMRTFSAVEPTQDFQWFRTTVSGRPLTTKRAISRSRCSGTGATQLVATGEKRASMATSMPR